MTLMMAIIASRFRLLPDDSYDGRNAAAECLWPKWYRAVLTWVPQRPLNNKGTLFPTIWFS